MRNLIILLLIACGLVIVQSPACAQNIEYADIYITPETDTDFFSGYVGGDAVESYDWAIGNGVPYGSIITKDMVFSTYEDSSFQERMRITMGGNVGIGVADPGTDKLKVDGNVDATGFSINGTSISTSSDSYWNAFGSDIYYDSGNVGIGTTSPDYDLDVAGNINFTGDLYQNGSLFSGDGNGGTTSMWQTFGTDIYYNDGNIGIGTESPETGCSLTIETSSVSDDYFYGKNSGGKKTVLLGNDGRDNGLFILSDLSGNSNIVFFADTNENSYINVGNVGIGTTTPGYKLEVNGDVRFNGDIIGGGSGKKVFSNGLTNVGWNGEDITIESFSGYDVVLQPTSGNVGIGTTSPKTALHLSSSSGTAISIDSSDSSIDRWIIYSTEESGSAQLSFEDTDTANTVMVMNGDSGKIGIGTASPNYPLEMGSGAHVTSGGVWTDASSREYKNNIHNLTFEEAKTALEELTPTRYYYNVDNEDEYLGFIAEDVPDLVATKDRKGLSPMDIVAVLTKVVQQQQREIEELKALFNNGQ